MLKYNNKCISDSFEIYNYVDQCIIKLGIDGLEDQEVTDFQKKLEKLFFKYSLGRCGYGKNIKFFRTWSNLKDSSTSISTDFHRALMSCYFFILIYIGRAFCWFRGVTPFSIDIISQDLRRWDELLVGKNFFSGSDVGILDYAFFGHVECMASGPTDELLDLFRSFPQLMTWLRKMLDKNPNYGPMYSKRIFTGDPVTKNNSGFYWPFLFSLIALAPLTIIMLIILFTLRFRGGNYSGAKIAK